MAPVIELHFYFDLLCHSNKERGPEMNRMPFDVPFFHHFFF